MTDDNVIELLVTVRKRSLGQGNVFTPVCQSFCSREGAWMAGEGSCMAVCVCGGGGRGAVHAVSGRVCMAGSVFMAG